jgi:TPR repeat protein
VRIRIGLLLFVGVFLASGAIAQTGEPAMPDFGGDHFFSYVPPKGWKVAEFPGLKYKIARGEPAQGFAPNIVVTTEEYAGSLDDYELESSEVLKKFFEGIVFLEKSDFKTSDGVRGIKIVAERDEKIGDTQKRLRQLQFSFKSGSTVLVVTCMRLADGDKAIDQQFDSAMKTFRFASASERGKSSAPGRESTGTTDWKHYSNPKVGISFNYPTRSKLYESKDQLPENLKKVWLSSHLAFCIDPTPPMINFNIAIAKEAVPSSATFALHMDALYDQICKQQNLTRLSFKASTVAGREAAEMIALAKPDLKMKMVSIHGYDDTVFMLAFFAPATEFDSSNKEIFKPWIEGVKIVKPGEGQEQSASPMRKKAEEGDALNQVHLGLAYEAGKGVPRDFGEAVKWYGKAADQGQAQGQYNLARMYDRAKGVDRDYPKALELYRKSAEQGYASAQVNLGVMYEKGQGVPQNYSEAVNWYRKAAEQGNAVGQNNLGFMYRMGHGVERDYAKALQLYRKAAEQGNSNAQGNLGFMHQNGYGVPKDDKEAVLWYRKSAEQGYAPAQANLGYMYEKGLAVPKDDKEAVNWYRKSADQGNPTGQNNLGGMYQTGRGVERDYQKSLELYRKAAAQNHSGAQCNMGIMCKNGYGVPKDEKEAVGWFRKSADQGYARGQYNLGWMYHQGVGVPEDREEALKWYRKAAAQGNEDAKKALSLMDAKSEPDKPK